MIGLISRSVGLHVRRLFLDVTTIWISPPNSSGCKRRKWNHRQPLISDVRNFKEDPHGD